MVGRCWARRTGRIRLVLRYDVVCAETTSSPDSKGPSRLSARSACPRCTFSDRTPRDEAGPDSDIDVFVDPNPATIFGFLPFMGAMETIQDAVGANLDYGTRKRPPSAVEVRHRAGSRARLLMAKPTVYIWLADIRDEIEGIRTLTRETDAEAFAEQLGDEACGRACLLIIAEASKHIPPDLKARHPDVPWRKIHGLGNLLRHEYRRIDPGILWSLVTDHLGDLDVAVAALMLDSAP